MSALKHWSLVHCIVCGVLHCILLIIINYNVQQSTILYYVHCAVFYSSITVYANLCGTVLYCAHRAVLSSPVCCTLYNVQYIYMRPIWGE